MSEDITYEEFGRRFFARAVTAERVEAGFRGLTEAPIAFGPIGVGPGRVARVSASGQVGAAAARPVAGDLIGFTLRIPVDLDLEVDLNVDRHRFRSALVITLRIRARAADPLRVVIDVEAPTAADVDVTVKAQGLRAEALRRVAGIDAEIARFVARYIAREIDKPHIRAARDIDVAAGIDRAWRG